MSFPLASGIILREGYQTSLEVGQLALFGAFSGPELYYKYPNGDEVYNVTIVYLTRDWHGNVKLNDEHTEWRWFTHPEIPEDISPPIIPVIEHFKRTNLTLDT